MVFNLWEKNLIHIAIMDNIADKLVAETPKEFQQHPMQLVQFLKST